MKALSLSFTTRLLDFFNELLGQSRYRREIAGLRSGSEITAHPQRDRAGFDPIGDVFEIDSARRHELGLRERAFHRFNERGAQDFSRENLHDVSAPFHSFDHFANCRRPGHIGDLIPIAETGSVWVEGGTDDELCTRKNGNACRLRIENRTGTKQDLRGSPLREMFDDSACARHCEGYLQGSDTTESTRFGNAFGLFAVIGPDHSDQARGNDSSQDFILGN